MEWLNREINLIGKDGISILNNTEITVFGLGGVGSYVLETLVRAGVGNINIVDNDVIDKTNINRQIYALSSTIGKKKVDIAMIRCLDINPNVKIKSFDIFIKSKEEIENIVKNSDYVLDCIDTISSKLNIIEVCNNLNIPIISSMGTGNKLDPFKFKIMDIFDTKNCSVSKIIRKELRKRNINSLKVISSSEDDKRIDKNIKEISSISFVPSVVGILITSECIKDILKL